MPPSEPASWERTSPWSIVATSHLPKLLPPRRAHPVIQVSAYGGAPSSGDQTCHPELPEPFQSQPNAVYKRCTRGAQGMLKPTTHVHLLCSSCTPLVHGVRRGRLAIGWGHLVPGCCWGYICRKLLIYSDLLIARGRPGRDDRAGDAFLGLPAGLFVAVDDENLWPEPGWPKYWALLRRQRRCSYQGPRPGFLRQEGHSEG